MLVYRTVCDVPGAEVALVASNLFGAWIGEKHPDLQVPDEGRASQGAATVTVSRAQGEDLEAFEGKLEEESEHGHWTTTLTAGQRGAERWVWVDVERVSDDPYAEAPVPQPPRLVKRLLENHSCFAGGIAVSPIVGDINKDPGILVDELLHEERGLPVVVVSNRWGEATGERKEAVDKRAAELARGLAGIAHVRRLDATATTRLQDGLGQLAVWGGAIRVYRPAMTMDDASYKHPILPYQRIRNPRQALRVVQSQVARFAASRRPPELYRSQIRQLSGFPGARHDSTSDEFLESYERLEEDLGRKKKEIEEANVTLGVVREDNELLILEKQEVDQELASAAAHIAFLQARTAESGKPAYALESEMDPPRMVEGCEEAVEAAEAELQLVEVSDGAKSAASKLDADGKASNWGARAWRAFRAFQRYADAKAADPNAFANFWDFSAEHDQHAEKLPTNWLAMKESETVDQSGTFRSARTFSVPQEVDASGRLYMPAHIKIQAGKPPAPRVHFHDDTQGQTGKVWVGYFGEHLPSGSTN